MLAVVICESRFSKFRRFNENWASHGKILRWSDTYELRIFLSVEGVAGRIEGHVCTFLR